MTKEKLELMWEAKVKSVESNFSKLKKDKRFQEQLETLR